MTPDEIICTTCEDEGDRHAASIARARRELEAARSAVDIEWWKFVNCARGQPVPRALIDARTAAEHRLRSAMNERHDPCPECGRGREVGKP